jgi:nucleoside-diphosphate-sugar epimerase
LEFVVVPDITVDTALAGKLDSVDYVLHVAPYTDREQLWVPAVKGTASILKEAAKVPSVKKVVTTSSIAALLPIGQFPEGGVVKDKISFT